MSRRVVTLAHDQSVTVHEAVRVLGHRLTVRASSNKSAPKLTVRVHKVRGRPSGGTPRGTGGESTGGQPAPTSGSPGASAPPAGTSGTSGATGVGTTGAGAPGTTGSTGTTSTTGTTGSVLFDGTSLASWGSQSAAPSRNQEVPDPDGQGDTVIRLTAYNSDVAPLTPTDNPRTQLVSSYYLPAGQTVWASYELYLPPTFPVADVVNDPTGWLEFDCPAYGEPFNGSPLTGVGMSEVGGIAQFNWQADAFYTPQWKYLWNEPVVLGQWIRFTWEYTVGASGITALYVNDQLVAETPQGAIDGSDNHGPWTARIMLYYAAGMFPQLTAYFKDFKIATTQAAAEG